MKEVLKNNPRSEFFWWRLNPPGSGPIYTLRGVVKTPSGLYYKLEGMQDFTGKKRYRSLGIKKVSVGKEQKIYDAFKRKWVYPQDFKSPQYLYCTIDPDKNGSIEENPAWKNSHDWGDWVVNKNTQEFSGMDLSKTQYVGHSQDQNHCPVWRFQNAESHGQTKDVEIVEYHSPMMREIGYWN